MIFLLVNGHHSVHLLLTLCSCVSSCVLRRIVEPKPRTKFVMHFAIVKESATCCNVCMQFVQKWGPCKLKKTWLTLKTLDMEVKIDLYGFVTFFFVDRTQKIKIKKWFQKSFLTPGTHSNPLITSQYQEDRRQASTQSNLETSTPCTTSLVISGLKQYWNDQCSLVHTGL